MDNDKQQQQDAAVKNGDPTAGRGFSKDTILESDPKYSPTATHMFSSQTVDSDLEIVSNVWQTLNTIIHRQQAADSIGQSEPLITSCKMRMVGQQVS